MGRLLIYIVLITVAGLAAVWVAEQPGWGPDSVSPRTHEDDASVNTPD